MHSSCWAKSYPQQTGGLKYNRLNKPFVVFHTALAPTVPPKTKSAKEGFSSPSAWASGTKQSTQGKLLAPHSDNKLRSITYHLKLEFLPRMMMPTPATKAILQVLIEFRISSRQVKNNSPFSNTAHSRFALQTAKPNKSGATRFQQHTVSGRACQERKGKNQTTVVFSRTK